MADDRIGRAVPSYWTDEPEDHAVTIKGRPDVARHIASALLDRGFDIAYAYRPLHDEQLAHAFLNTVLFLDHRRTGFPWPMVPMPINCYGSKVIAAQGGWKPFGEALDAFAVLFCMLILACVALWPCSGDETEAEHLADRGTPAEQLERHQ